MPGVGETLGAVCVLVALLALWIFGSKDEAPDQPGQAEDGKDRSPKNTATSSSAGKKKKRRKKSGPTASTSRSEEVLNKTSSEPSREPEAIGRDKKSQAKPRVTSKGKALPSSSEPSLTVGSRVEAKPQGRSRYVAGTVGKVNKNGTLNIKFDDGTEEFGLPPDSALSMETVEAMKADVLSIAKTSVPSLADHAMERSLKTQLTEGTRVEARWNGGNEYFPGVVSKVHHGGLCNIQYDDGEVETKIPPTMIRRLGEEETVAHEESRSESDWESDLEGVEEDEWQVIRKPKKPSKASRLEQQAVEAANLRNRKKKQKKKERERIAREQFRESIQ